MWSLTTEAGFSYLPKGLIVNPPMTDYDHLWTIASFQMFRYKNVHPIIGGHTINQTRTTGIKISKYLSHNGQFADVRS